MGAWVVSTRTLSNGTQVCSLLHRLYNANRGIQLGSSSNLFQYCIFSPSPGKCKAWLREEYPEVFINYYANDQTLPIVEGLTKGLGEVKIEPEQIKGSAEPRNIDNETEDSTHQKRGGKGMPRDMGKKLEKEDLKRYDLKKVAKRLAGKYACGCSVVQAPAGYDEIVLQGDFVDDLIEFIPEEWPEISDEQVDILEK